MVGGSADPGRGSCRTRADRLWCVVRAFRPWQHVLEPLAGYLKLAEQLWRPPTCRDLQFRSAHQEAASVRDVVMLARQSFGCGEVTWGEGGTKVLMSGWLALEIARPGMRWGIAALVPANGRGTNDGWYRRQQDGAAARELCERISAISGGDCAVRISMSGSDCRHADRRPEDR